MAPNRNNTDLLVSEIQLQCTSSVAALYAAKNGAPSTDHNFSQFHSPIKNGAAATSSLGGELHRSCRTPFILVSGCCSRRRVWSCSLLPLQARLCCHNSFLMGGPIEAVVAAVSGAFSSAAALVTGKAPEEDFGDRDGRQDDKDLEKAGRQASGDQPARPGDNGRGTAGGPEDQLAPAADQEKEPFSDSTGRTNPHCSSAQDTRPKRDQPTERRPQQPQVQGAASKQARVETAAPAKPKPPAKPDATSGDATAPLRPQQGRTAEEQGRTAEGEASVKPAVQAKPDPPAKAEAAAGDGPGPMRPEPQQQQQQQQRPSDFVQRQHFGPSKLGGDRVGGSMAPMAPMNQPAGVQPGTSFSVQTSNNTHSEVAFRPLLYAAVGVYDCKDLVRILLQMRRCVGVGCPAVLARGQLALTAATQATSLVQARTAEDYLFPCDLGALPCCADIVLQDHGARARHLQYNHPRRRRLSSASGGRPPDYV